MSAAAEASLTSARAFLHRAFVGRAEAGLREEDEKKALELSALTQYLGHVLARAGRARPLSVVDAAAGKGYVGLFLAEQVLAPALRAQPERSACVTVIERDAGRLARAGAAVDALQAPGVEVALVEANVEDTARWPETPTLVVALHACGFATDGAIASAAAVGARHVVIVPCCTAVAVAQEKGAARAAARLGLPEHGLVRKAFAEAFVLAERTWALEALGYETEVSAFVPESVTPYNLLLHGRRVCEPVRTARAVAALANLRGGASIS